MYSSFPNVSTHKPQSLTSSETDKTFDMLPITITITYSSFSTNFSLFLSLPLSLHPRSSLSIITSSLIPEVIRMTTDPIIIRKLMNTTHCRQSMILIINNLCSRSLNILDTNSINPTKYLSCSHPPTIRK